MAFVKADTAQYSCKISGEVFQVLNIDIQEEMSGLFRIGLNLWSDNPEVAIQPMLRQPAEITIAWEEKEKTYHGIVAGIRQTEAGRIGAVDKEYGHYAVEVVPNLWLLSHLTNCRIFQNLPVDKIITKVLGERCPTQQYEMKLQKSYKPREYCVQYRETDLAFISRLMEEEGIFYYFTHDGPEKMVIGDAPTAYGTCAPEEKANYAKPTGDLAKKDEYFDQLTYEENVYSGKVTFKDFDYMKPKSPLKVDASAEKQTDLEIYDFHPQRYNADGHGRGWPPLPWKRSQRCGPCCKRRATGGRCRPVVPSPSRRRTVRISTKNGSSSRPATARARWRDRLSGVGCGHPGGRAFSAPPDHAAAIAEPSDSHGRRSRGRRNLHGRPRPRQGPVPLGSGGQAGRKDHLLDPGRAAYAGMNEKTGKKHGFHWHPLIGDEVIVDFLEGDPDNPIIVGSVYNGDNTPLIKPDEHIRNMMLHPLPAPHAFRR